MNKATRNSGRWSRVDIKTLFFSLPVKRKVLILTCIGLFLLVFALQHTQWSEVKVGQTVKSLVKEQDHARTSGGALENKKSEDHAVAENGNVSIPSKTTSSTEKDILLTKEGRHAAKNSNNLTDDDFALEGGVLPVRRFQITGGIIIHTVDQQSRVNVAHCNSVCLLRINCDAWQVSRKGTCKLFAENSNNPLDAYQADNNDPSSVIGFMQKNAGVLRPVQSIDETSGDQENVDLSSRVLYVLHFHHFVVANVLQKLLNNILPSSWNATMDLVVISPREVVLHAASIHYTASRNATRITSLRNPFRARARNSKRGANGHMSLPIARSKFPGYGGYLLVNDDGMVRTWDLRPDIWLADRPWLTISNRFNNTVAVVQSPNGRDYSKDWSNFDSGSVGQTSGRTRSNFDASLDALNEFCSISEFHEMGKKYCDHREVNVVYPYVASKSDILYVPGNSVGLEMTKAMALFGEHDVMMEMAWPMVFELTRDVSEGLFMPYCNGWKGPPYKKLVQPPQAEGRDLGCPTIHAIKFSKPVSYDYWKKIVETECSWCVWKDGTEISWSV